MINPLRALLLLSTLAIACPRPLPAQEAVAQGSQRAAAARSAAASGDSVSRSA